MTAGGLLLLAAFVAGTVTEIAVHWRRFQLPLLAAGAVVLLGGVLRPPPGLARAQRGLCVVSIALIVGVAVVEVFFRVVRFDFRHQAALWQQTPPFFRKPTVPVGTVFFRRDGPLEWTGPVTRRVLEVLNFDAAAYADEPAITVRYDELGFRNEPRPAAWEIVIAGDSFTELGHLPFAELFTTWLAQALGLRVLNLGVGNTGPLTQLSYLENYGVSPATREAMLVFFEGNDLADLAYEREAELRFQATGKRPFREFRPQTSFLRAVGERIRARRARPPRNPPPPVDAWFLGQTGRVAVTLGPPPPRGADLTPATAEALESCFSRFAAWGRQHGIRTWLAYMPGKQRVWHTRLEFASAAPEALTNWTPTDLPGVVAESCARHGIRFVDLTPALVADTQVHGEPVFNHLYDSHLNARGSRLVAQALARLFMENGGPKTATVPAANRRREQLRSSD
mgnify:CR=1 FL=1